jgi:hypothetical protein
MKASPARGQEYPPMQWEEVPLPTPAPVDRATMETAHQRELPTYRPFPMGRKAELARRYMQQQAQKGKP